MQTLKSTPKSKPVHEQPPESGGEVIMRCEKVHKSYALGRTLLPVLRGVSVEIRCGQFLVIMGSSGSGKSTLLHVMSALDVPQRGQVYFRDQPMFEPEGQRSIPLGRDANVTMTAATGRDGAGKRSPGTVASGPRHLDGHRNRLRNRAFGFVFQFYHLLPEFDVLENVLLPKMVGQHVGGWLTDRVKGQQRAMALLERVGLAGRLHHRPNELSGGERQRVAIARALINDPEVLFADEPTGNLDAATGLDILRLLKELNESGQTIVMVTHDRELAREADQVVRLSDGRLQ